MTDTPDIAPTPEPVPATIAVSDVVALMSSVEHDVVGQCWQLWSELKALVDKAGV